MGAAAVLAACGGPAATTDARTARTARPAAPKADAAFTRLSAAVRALGTTRAAVLTGLEAVQGAATSLDRADEVCMTGDGVTARAAHRAAEPASAQATAALAALPGRLAGYEGALTALDQAGAALVGGPRAALQRVVADGRAEASAGRGFRAAAATVWPVYQVLDQQEATWVTRALTPWYRDAKEGANAYAVLVSDARPALEDARARLGGASSAAGAASARASVSLAAADRALDTLRSPAG